ncbi:hypothetical protein EJB05_46164, partial [Eragrostis curvula]
MRPSIVLFGDSVKEEAFGEGGWGAHHAPREPLLTGHRPAQIQRLQHLVHLRCSGSRPATPKKRFSRSQQRCLMSRHRPILVLTPTFTTRSSLNLPYDGQVQRRHGMPGGHVLVHGARFIASIMSSSTTESGR